MIGGFNDKQKSLGDFPPDEFDEMLEDPETFEGTPMPPFTGTEAERKALIEFLSPYFAKGGE